MRPGTPPAPQNGIPAFKATLMIVVVLFVGWLLLDKTTGPTTTAKQPSAGSATTTHSKSKSKSNTTSTVPPATTTTTVVLIPASAIKLQVLNGVGTGSLAGEWSTKLRTNFGYNTLAPDNSTAVVSSSIIYVITPGYVPEADALATSVGLTSAAVSPTTPASAPIRASERTTANLVLVIGPDLAKTA